MVCQNQSIDDSDAPLARDLRLLVRERLKAGDSDQQVLDFLVARYGEFVLLKPRFRLAYCAAVARAAVVLLLGGAERCVPLLRRRSAPDRRKRRTEPALSAAEEARVARTSRRAPAQSTIRRHKSLNFV